MVLSVKGQARELLLAVMKALGTGKTSSILKHF